MSLVDGYEAITHKEVIEEIRSCSGSQFDPAWAELFTSFLETWEPED